MAKDQNQNDSAGSDVGGRTGGNTDEQPKDLGRNQFHNPDKPRAGQHDGQVSEEADHSSNPTNPVKVRPSHGSGKPG
ncbi:hypothetical protein [Azospirillum rugosum]|uniref:Uncharacterized protein n=1 Tax=Azospirillum rugosum TaxID=416170 RepID=A0ABS4SHF6_9PROT|nr:hypothetical protein [Azospirillum rugosum]MBP2292003.1 hypothetical protein [Azospirillum rugosum]MDQ0525861.1 hypothetical protein [Azospirillum rugosum]